MIPPGTMGRGRRQWYSMLLGLFVLSGWPVTAPGAIDLQIETRQPLRISLDASDEALDQVLEQLAARLGFKLEIDGDLGAARGNWRLYRQRLPALLETLTRGHGLLILYADGATRVVEVQVYGRPEVRSSGMRATRAAPASSQPRRAAATQAPIEAEPAADTEADNRTERQAMLSALSGFDDEGNLEMIAEFMRNDPDPAIRRQAIAMLASQGGDSAFRWLDECLTDLDPGIRAHCVNSMAQITAPEVTAAMSQMLYGDDDRQVRRAVINTLASQDDKQAGLLLEAVRDDPGMELQDEAGRALEQWQRRLTESVDNKQRKAKP